MGVAARPRRVGYKVAPRARGVLSHMCHIYMYKPYVSYMCHVSPSRRGSGAAAGAGTRPDWAPFFTFSFILYRSRHVLALGLALAE